MPPCIALAVYGPWQARQGGMGGVRPRHRKATSNLPKGVGRRVGVPAMVLLTQQHHGTLRAADLRGQPNQPYGQT